MCWCNCLWRWSAWNLKYHRLRDHHSIIYRLQKKFHLRTNCYIYTREGLMCVFGCLSVQKTVRISAEMVKKDESGYKTVWRLKAWSLNSHRHNKKWWRWQRLQNCLDIHRDSILATKLFGYQQTWSKMMNVTVKLYGDHCRDSQRMMNMATIQVRDMLLLQSQEPMFMFTFTFTLMLIYFKQAKSTTFLNLSPWPLIKTNVHRKVKIMTNWE